VLDKPQRMKFQKPREDSGRSLEWCIYQQWSVRGFRARRRITDEFGQLLWATRGITAAGGRRSVPSPGALHPLDLYAVIGQVSTMTPGVYRYFRAPRLRKRAAAGTCPCCKRSFSNMAEHIKRRHRALSPSKASTS